MRSASVVPDVTCLVCVGTVRRFCVVVRVLLVKGFKIRQTQRFSDYKKFGVSTASEIAPPAAAAP